MTTTATETTAKQNNEKVPLLSVVVPIYNVEQYVEKAIESICTQTLTDMEIILIDDGSKDQSGSLCDEYAQKDDRIRVLHKENGGLSSARNAGIEVATGKYIAFVDSDDWIDPEMYAVLTGLLEKNQADLAICSYKEVSAGAIPQPTKGEGEITVWENQEALQVFIEEQEAYNIQNAAWNKVYKRSLMGELRFPEGKLFEDIAYTTKLIGRSKKTIYTSQPFYNYVVNRSGSIMNQTISKRIFTDQIPMYMEKRAYLEEIGRRDLVQIHNRFFYKRLLLHYVELQKHKPEDYEALSKELVDLLHEEKANIKSAYASAAANPKEKKRVELFLKSPQLYKILDQINEAYLIPNKQVLRAQGTPEIILQLSGGMGNQMFQYALYLQLKALGKNVKIDDTTEYSYSGTRPKRLEVFGISYPTATETEIKTMRDAYVDLASKVRRKLTGRKNAEYAEKSQRFDAQVLQLDRAYLVGYWQSEKYFVGCKETVKEAFTFQNLTLNEKMQQYLDQIQSTEAVSIHIRRGDYLEVNTLYGGICTPEYYEKAIAYMEKEVENPHFYVFTNDPEWAKEQYGHLENFTIVEGNDEDAGYIDLYLMTKCKHYILANSSFSWWGCYLSENETASKQVIAPKQWFQGRDCQDIYTEEMKVLS